MFLATNDISFASQSKQRDITLSWSSLNAQTIPSAKGYFFSCFQEKTVEHPKQILHNVSGLAKPRELLAIMGSSGAGKTTLLNILTMRNQGNLILTGDVYINNKVVTNKIIAAISAYVQQETLFIGTLTVKEQLTFHALLRIGEVKYEEKLNRVEEVIQELELSKCQNNLIGIPGRVKGISGGEKKRLAVACELLTNPNLLLCDEPTSGLDSYKALSVVNLLRNLALKGKTVLFTIHQPSSEIYNLFDKVLYLVEGRVAYLGSRDGALEFFNSLNYECPVNYNPADYFVQTLTISAEDTEAKQQEVSVICNAFAKSHYFTELSDDISKIKSDQIKLPDVVIKSRYKVPWFTQLRTVMWRSVLAVSKEPILIKIRFTHVVYLALLFGMCYFHQDFSQMSIQNINSAIYLLMVNCTYQNIIPVIHVFCSELPIFLNEHSSGLYGATAYFFSKVLADQMIFIFAPFLYILLSYWLIGFYPSVNAFFFSCLVYILVSNCAASLGYFISAISTNTAMAAMLSSFLITPLYLFGGFFIRKKSVPWYLQWLPYISWFEYGFEALTIIQWQEVSHIECNLNNSTCPKNGLEILKTYGFTPNLLWIDIFSLIVLIIVIRIVALILIVMKTRKTSGV